MENKVRIFAIILFVLTGEALSQLPPDFCEGIFVGIFPHPDDCTKYVMCIMNNPNVINCNSNEVFWPPQEMCLPGE